MKRRSLLAAALVVAVAAVAVSAIGARPTEPSVKAVIEAAWSSD